MAVCRGPGWLYDDGDIYLGPTFVMNIFGEQPTQSTETTWGRKLPHQVDS